MGLFFYKGAHKCMGIVKCKCSNNSSVFIKNFCGVKALHLRERETNKKSLDHVFCFAFTFGWNAFRSWLLQALCKNSNFPIRYTILLFSRLDNMQNWNQQLKNSCFSIQILTQLLKNSCSKMFAKFTETSAVETFLQIYPIDKFKCSLRIY